MRGEELFQLSQYTLRQRDWIVGVAIVSQIPNDTCSNDHLANDSNSNYPRTARHLFANRLRSSIDLQMLALIADRPTDNQIGIRQQIVDVRSELGHLSSKIVLHVVRGNKEVEYCVDIDLRAQLSDFAPDLREHVGR